MNNQLSNADNTAPVVLDIHANLSPISSLLVITAPAKISLCPVKYFVAE